MYTTRVCGCKGCRTCLACEAEYGIHKDETSIKNRSSYVYCPLCNKAYSGWDLNAWREHPNHEGEGLYYEGVYIQLDFVANEEEETLMQEIEGEPWDLSQSGRRKQNYGPKCNFKKRKLRLGNFAGFPQFTKFVQDKFNDVEMLKDFQTIEQCSLEYDPSKGASIDPHIDDCWIWGERVVTVNLLSDSVLTMTSNKDNEKYNLNLVEMYPKVLNEQGDFASDSRPYELKEGGNDDFIIRIPLIKRSLLVLYGSARYDWEHQVLREDIKERRVCIAYREFTPPYLPGGEKYSESIEVIKKAREFW